MVDRHRLQTSISYGGIGAFVLALVPFDPTGVSFVVLFPVLTAVFAVVLYWTGWFVTE